MKALRVAAVQMVSGTAVAENLDNARRLTGEAAAMGARLVVLPEGFASLGSDDAAALGAAERDRGGPLRSFLAATAREYGVMLVGGTVPVGGESAAARPRAACFVHGDDGRELARYDKIHLFDVDLPDRQRRYRESDSFEAGERLCCVQTACGMLGLAVCYDLRFPELFRGLSDRGMEILALPSAFTQVTGAAHWHVLVRARAIENQVFVIAAAQGGTHSATRHTWGGSAIVDPWGRVLASRAAGEGVVCADLDPGSLEEARARLPVLGHRRFYAPD